MVGGARSLYGPINGETQAFGCLVERRLQDWVHGACQGLEDLKLCGDRKDKTI